MSEDKKQLEELSEEDVLELAKAKGRRLGFLIDNSTLPDDVKNQMVLLIEKISPEKIDKLLDVMEAKYLDEANKHIDEEYKDKLQKVVTKFQNEDETTKKKIQEQLDSVLAI